MPALAALAGHRWDNGYETFPPTTLQVTDVQAGTGASNVIPGELQVVFNLRFNPSWTAEKLEQEIEDILRRHGVDYSIQWLRGGEPFYTPEGHLRATARAVLG